MDCFLNDFQHRQDEISASIFALFDISVSLSIPSTMYPSESAQMIEGEWHGVMLICLLFSGSVPVSDVWRAAVPSLQSQRRPMVHLEA